MAEAIPPKSVRIELHPAGRRCRIWVNGEEVKGVRAFTVHGDVNGVTTVTLEMANVTGIVEGEAHVIKGPVTTCSSKK